MTDEQRAKMSVSDKERKNHYKTKPCQLCGKEYQPTSPFQKYCPECGLVEDKAGRAARDKIRYPARRADPKQIAYHAKYSAKWCEANPEKSKASDAKYRKVNREKATEWTKAWHEAHPGYSATWYEANRQKVKENHARWYEANSEKSVVYCNKRRAAKYANTPVDEWLTPTEWLAKLAEAKGHCHYCDKVAKLTLDHVIPVSKGGKHSKDNVVPACGPCNYSKGNKTLEEWLTQKGLRELQTQGAIL